ncbi:MAG TPA: pseudouridine synthase [Acidimicrobiales bacterium]|nr:pseudouridine synthase [Acidimicrobiales bacterium]
MTGETSGERLQKVLARAGIGSRRVCDELIEEGRVTVNGEVARPGQRVDVESDRIRVDSVPVGVLPGLVHYLVNKPAGVVVTASDPEGRPTILDLVPPEPRVFSVGRLDYATEGLIVLTNDGELSQLLTHPSHGVEKEYLAQVRGEVTPGAIRALREGVEIEPGVTTQPARVANAGNNILKIVIHEGKNRQVRRMCDAVSLPVIRLVRTRIGSISDTQLAPGSYRHLTQDEVRKLSEVAVRTIPRLLDR